MSKIEEAANAYTDLHFTIYPDGVTDKGQRYRAFKAGAKYIIDSVRAEIERRKEQDDFCGEEHAQFEYDVACGHENALIEIGCFLDELEKDYE